MQLLTALQQPAAGAADGQQPEQQRCQEQSRTVELARQAGPACCQAHRRDQVATEQQAGRCRTVQTQSRHRAQRGGVSGQSAERAVYLGQLLQTGCWVGREHVHRGRSSPRLAGAGWCQSEGGAAGWCWCWYGTVSPGAGLVSRSGDCEACIVSGLVRHLASTPAPIVTASTKNHRAMSERPTLPPSSVVIQILPAVPHQTGLKHGQRVSQPSQNQIKRQMYQHGQYTDDDLSSDDDSVPLPLLQPLRHQPRDDVPGMRQLPPAEEPH